MRDVQLFAVIESGPIPLPVPEQARHVHDLFDDLPVGVYTALATFDHNKFLLLNDHLDRLEKSMDLLDWDYRLDRLSLRRALDQVVSDYPLPNARVRIDVLSQAISVQKVRSRLLIALSPFVPIPETIYEQGVSVGTIRGLVRSQPLVKRADFVFQRRKCFENKPDLYECLLLDDGGYILEGTTSNFFAIRDGRVWTAGEGMLEGIARRIVLQVATETGIPVVLEPVHIDDVRDIDEAALSSSSRAIVPIVKIDQRQIRSGRPGPITGRLLHAYRQVVEQVIRPAFTAGE